jgi:hypothetical protein
MSEKMRLYVQVQDTPKEAQKSFNNGRFSGTDINPMWRIKRLTELFGPAGIGWWTEDEHYMMEKSEDTSEVAVFCTLKLFYKDPETGEISHGVTGVGGNKFVVSQRNGAYCNDEAFKMAYTDALSIACKALGFSADIYYANDRTKYTMNNDVQPAGMTSDTAQTIAEIDKLARQITASMTAEEKKAFAEEQIAAVIGKMNYKLCKDQKKLETLLANLRKHPNAA